jgi:hypothetical protein
MFELLPVGRLSLQMEAVEFVRHALASAGDHGYRMPRRGRLARWLRRLYVPEIALARRTERGGTGIPMGQAMSTYAVPIAISAVAVVLLLGLINMMRGGSPNTSQRLMRLRVLLQFVAIIIIMITIWALGR